MDGIYILAGALTGFIVGLTGVGGGALMTPILLLLFGVNPTVAVATDLWFATLTKTAALLVHRHEQQIDWQVVRRLWLGSLPAALLVVSLLSMGLIKLIPSHFLTVLIGSIILFTSVGMLLKNWFSSYLKLHYLNSKPQFQALLTTIAGIIIGLLVSLTSVGAGVLGSVFLIYIYPTRMTPTRLVGTDIAHAIPLALLAGIGYLLAGKVNAHLLLLLLLGSIPAAVIGSLVATRMSDGRLRYFIAAILSISGLRLMF